MGKSEERKNNLGKGNRGFLDRGGCLCSGLGEVLLLKCIDKEV